MFETPDVSDGKLEKKFVHASGRSVSGSVVGQELIGQGVQGTISRADIIFESENLERETKKRSLLIKEYAHPKKVENSLRVHAALKEAGINTWPTYRRIEGENSIVMTDGGREGDAIVSVTGHSQDQNRYEDRKPQELTGFEKALEGAIELATRAGNSKIYLPDDAWFAVLRDDPKKEESVQSVEAVKFFPGDFDFVATEIPGGISFKDARHIHENRMTSDKTVYANLVNLYIFCDKLIDRYLDPDSQEKTRLSSEAIIAAVAKEMDKRDDEVGRWNIGKYKYIENKERARASVLLKAAILNEFSKKKEK